jgi:hypothetical protein
MQEAAHVLCRDGLKLDVLRRNYPGAEQRFRADQARKGRNDPFDYNALYKWEPGAIAKHVPTVGRFMTDVRAIPVQIIEPHMLGTPGYFLVDKMREFMSRYELMSADAYHLAIAYTIGATSLATLDSDWLRAESDFTVLTDL